uniref:Tyrosinase B3.1 n=1 Tax=Pinctada maxima TaxID=104660 RepID=A0A024CI05_PINMA|nr:tyrosinase B3.1 [Pinctada maxima]
MRYLKFRTSAYDFFAGLHRSLRSFRNAHIGSNFLGWHRVYLWYFERILIRVGGVPLCYWDSTLDFRIEGSGQRNTTMFTSEVVGNGIGMVINGPFRNWPIPDRNVSLRREIASFASLMRPQVVDLIMTSNLIRNHSQISNGAGSVGMIDPDQGTRTSLESEHDNTHVWVGGVMSDATIAPQDPVFWLHHTYIDYVWEKFREKIVHFRHKPSQ